MGGPQFSFVPQKSQQAPGNPGTPGLSDIKKSTASGTARRHAPNWAVLAWNVNGSSSTRTHAVALHVQPAPHYAPFTERHVPGTKAMDGRDAGRLQNSNKQQQRRKSKEKV